MSFVKIAHRGNQGDAPSLTTLRLAPILHVGDVSDDLHES
jgi:hypothetical protein